MIEYISLEKIQEHPDNPRKDLGDIQELADSIRENGVLQNLTVVPVEGNTEAYMTVIGHRRCAAAKLAGLTEVPCAIKEMDHKTQVKTMLMENMQRSDLTPVEQAQGFQMMMDLGSTIGEIAKETGFSESTVRHRIKIAELDPELLKKKESQNISMKDYMRLEELRMMENKNEALEKIGTKDFDMEVERLKRKEKNEEIDKMLKEKLSHHATELEGPIDCKIVEPLKWMTKPNSAKGVEDMDLSDVFKEGEQYRFRIDQYGLALYRERQKQEQEEDNVKKEEEKRKEAELQARLKELDGIWDDMMTTRMRFVKHVPVSNVKSKLKKLLEKAAEIIVYDSASWNCAEEFMEMQGIKENEEDEEATDKEIEGFISRYPETSLFQAVCITMEETGGQKTYDWMGRYGKRTWIEELYGFLETFGYQTSEEERKMLDGTHQAYAQEDGADD